jgi:hypothetical protein
MNHLHGGTRRSAAGESDVYGEPFRDISYLKGRVVGLDRLLDDPFDRGVFRNCNMQRK